MNKISHDNQIRLDLLRELYKATIENGKSQWTNQTILSWIDLKKIEINRSSNDKSTSK